MNKWRIGNDKEHMVVGSKRFNYHNHWFTLKAFFYFQYQIPWLREQWLRATHYFPSAVSGMNDKNNIKPNLTEPKSPVIWHLRSWRHAPLPPCTSTVLDVDTPPPHTLTLEGTDRCGDSARTRSPGPWRARRARCDPQWSSGGRTPPHLPPTTAQL